MKKLFILLFLFIHTLNNGFSQCNNYSANFDGVNGYMESFLNNSTCSDFTMMFWVKFPDTLNAPLNNSLWLAAFPTYHSNYSGFTDGILYESGQNNTSLTSMNIHGYFWPNYFAPLHSLQQSYPGNTWTHFAYTRSASGTQKLYINGVLNNTDSVTAQAFISLQTKLNIGGHGSYMGGLGRWFTNCKIDELVIYNRELSGLEIDNKRIQVLDATQETGLLGYYRFEEGNGSLTLDLGPTNSFGSLIGGASFSSDTPFGTAFAGTAPNIIGADSVISGSVTSYTLSTNSTFVFWSIQNGVILSGQGTNFISVQWDPNMPVGNVVAITGSSNSCYSEEIKNITITPFPTQNCNSFSAYFDGTSSYMESLLDNSTCNDLTIMFWAKFPDTLFVPLSNSMWLAGFTTYHSNYSGYTDGIFYEAGQNNINSYDMNLSGYTWPNYFAPVRSTQQVYPGNTWIHFAYTRTSSGDQKIYIDGTLNNSDYYNPPTFLSTQTKFDIGGHGSYSGGIGRWFTNCYIDELVIYNRELSAFEINTKRFQVLDLTMESSLLAYYRFEEGTGTTTADLGPTSSTGSFYQSVSFSGDTPFNNNCSSAPRIMPTTSIAQNGTCVYSINLVYPYMDWSLTHGNIISGQGTNTIIVQWDLNYISGSIKILTGTSSTSNRVSNLDNISLSPLAIQEQNNQSLIYISNSNIEGAFDLHLPINILTAKYSLYDSCGKLISKKLIYGNIQTIDIGSLSKGIYILSVEIAGQTNTRLKISKTN